MKKWVMVIAVLVSQWSWADEQSDAKAWLQLIDQGQYGKSWEQAGDLFKKVISQRDWAKALHQVRAPLGKMQSRQFMDKETHTELPNAPTGEYLIMIYQSQFQHKPKATETLALAKVNGSWKAVGYFVR